MLKGLRFIGFMALLLMLVPLALVGRVMCVLFTTKKERRIDEMIENLVLVGHGGASRALLADYYARELEEMRRVQHLN